MLQQEIVDRLLHFHPIDAPVLSVYATISADPGELPNAETSFNSLLKPVRDLADSPGMTHGQRQSRIAGTFVIDPHTMTPLRVRERAEQVVASFEHDEETKLASRVLERVAAHGLAAAGLEGCLAAVNAMAVQLLLVQDDNEAPGRICRRCGWLGLAGDRCPVCDEPTRQTPDVVDEMVASVIDGGGQVEHVHEDAGLSKRLVAATLRFPVPDPRAGAGSTIPVSEEVSR